MSDISWFVLFISLAVIVFVYGKVKRRLDQLQQDIVDLQNALQLQEQSGSLISNQPATLPLTDNYSSQSSHTEQFDKIAVSSEFIADVDSGIDTNADPQYSLSKKLSPIEPDEQSLPIVTSLFHSLKNWFFGGNLVVRVGVIVLLVGVVLLLRLLSEYIEVSIESKLIAIGIIGLGLAALGLKLAKNRFAYGITLQGAGLAIAYLTTFFAYSVYQVLPSLPSFIGLGVLSAVTIALAVRQNAFPLALLALSGGFFAPILTANDTGSLTALFSYYLLLNVTIAIIAYYRTWKVLNLFGVLVTFALAYYWGLTTDLTAVIESQRYSLVLLVALHLALYLFVVIRYAQQIIAYNSASEAYNNANEAYNTNSALDSYALDSQSTNIKATSRSYVFPIDTGLLFSVPLLAFGLFSALLNDIANALTLTSAILAAIYLGLGLLFVKRSQHFALITEGMLALGFGFLALVIPLALDAEWVAFGWSVQGLALVWFGRRSLRAWSVLFGLLLQLISVAMIIVTLFFSTEDFAILTLSISAISFLAIMFILRSDNSPVLMHQGLVSATTQNFTSDSAAILAKNLAISEQAAHQWLHKMDNRSGAFNLIWRSPIFIQFLTFIAIIWALYVLVMDLEQWLVNVQIATTTLIALSALISLSVYWLVNRYQSWQEIRQFSPVLFLSFYVALILQLPQKFEFNHSWSSMNWALFIALVVGWLVVGPLWLKTWYKDSDLSRFDSASWLGTGVLVLAAAVHYGLSDSQGVMTILIPVAAMVVGLYFSYRHSKFSNIKEIKSEQNQGLMDWFNGTQALIDCAKLFLPVTLLWVILTNWSYDGVIWGLPYLPLINLYDLSLWLVVIYGLSTLYLNRLTYETYSSATALAANNLKHKATNPKPMLIILGLVSFWIVSSMLVRTLHAFIGTPLWDNAISGAWYSEQVQTGLTILWTLIALIATIIASRQLKRTPWFMGIGLLGVVVLKLVLVDLSQTEAIWRVLSFLVAGSLILLIGYLAPLPPEEAEKDAETQ